MSDAIWTLLKNLRPVNQRISCPGARGQEKIEKPTKSEEPLEEVVPRLDCRVVGFQTNDFETVDLCPAYGHTALINPEGLRRG
jgi:hypothetical protein